MADATNNIANKKKLTIQFFHVPTGHQVEFKAFLTEYSDKFESEWNSESVFGRMDPLETFQGTKRTITLAWAVPSYGLEEAQLNLSKASLLMSMLYPAYDEDPGTGAISAAPLFKLKFTNLIAQPGSFGQAEDVSISGLVGRVGGFNYTPDLEAGMFVPEGIEGVLYPKTINLQCEFTVFHTHRVGWTGGGKNVDWIAPDGMNGFPYGIVHPELKPAFREEEISPRTDAAKEAAVGEILE